MHKYLSLLLILIFLSSSYGNRNLNRTSHNIINLNQFDLETNDFRDEAELISFIETTMETHLIPGLSISIAKGGNIVWDNHFGYTNIM